VTVEPPVPHPPLAEPAGSSASHAVGVRIETVASESEFAALAGSWDTLVRAMPRPSPFLLHSWLLEWWRHYGGDSELAVHVAHRGDRLVGALPLFLRDQSGLRVCEFVGGTWSLLSDVLLEEGEHPSVGEALTKRAAASHYDFASLFGLPGSSRLVAALPRGSLRLVERLEAPVLDLTVGWAQVAATKLSPRARRTRARRRRQLEELGTVEASLARSREELAESLDDAFRVYALRWQGRHDPSGSVTPEGVAFRRAALLRLADQDVPRLLTLRLDGRAIAFALSLQLGERAYGLTRAFDPAYGRFSPGSEAKLLSLEAAAEEGIAVAEFLGAAGPHNQRFTDRFDPLYQGIGLPRTRRGRVAVEALLGGIRLRRSLKRSATAREVYQRVRRLKGS
jgi:CelD/BcsL family acetyltransferase involved in cellulose biosynthesis